PAPVAQAPVTRPAPEPVVAPSAPPPTPAPSPPLFKMPAPAAAPPTSAPPPLRPSAPQPGPAFNRAPARAPSPPGAPPAAPASPPSTPRRGTAPVNPFLSQDPSSRARRLARALVSDIVVYHPAKRRDGLRDGSLKLLFEEEIRKSWEEYIEQVGRELAESTSFFTDALNDILADGQPVFP